jgi:hypothetical protein
MGSRLGCHNLAHLLKASMCQCISDYGRCLSKERLKAGAKVAVMGEAQLHRELSQLGFSLSEPV